MDLGDYYTILIKLPDGKTLDIQLNDPKDISGMVKPLVENKLEFAVIYGNIFEKWSDVE
jgi:hypothetical protein